MTTPATATGPERTSPVPKTTTARTLHRLRLGLLAATLGVLVGSALVVQGARDTATALDGRTAPSVIEAVAARAALVEADAAAVASFRSGEARLAGPGVEYQNQVTLVSRSLTRFAESSMAGENASQQVQLVNGQLIAYLGLVGQADAHYRQTDGSALGLAYLWQASRLLHTDGGILDQLDELRDQEERLLDAQVASGWFGAPSVLVWAVPLLVLVILLGITQVFLNRRFRRVLNSPLLAATALTVLVAAAASFTLVAGERLVTAREQVDSMRGHWQARTELVDLRGQTALAALVANECPEGEGTCADLHERYELPEPGSDPPEVDDDDEFPTVGSVSDATAAAVSAANVVLLAPLTALAIGGLVLLGLHARLDEYRYRKR